MYLPEAIYAKKHTACARKGPAALVAPYTVLKDGTPNVSLILFWKPPLTQTDSRSASKTGFRFERSCHLYYDKNCTLCTRFARYVKKLDQEQMIFCIPYQETERLPFGLEKDQLAAAVHLVYADGRIFIGPSAMEELCCILPGIQKVSWMLQTNYGRGLNRLIYGFASRWRRHKCPSCPG